MSETIEEERFEEEFEVFPDDTTFFTFEKAEEIFETLERKRFTVSDIVLILLFAHHDKPLFGRVSMMKQVFLLIEEILEKEEIQEAKYIPYRYGMYSFTVGNALSNLVYSGLIDRRGRKNSKLEQFYLTDKGKEKIISKYSSLPTDLQKEISEKRKGWDQLGYDGILRFVYQKYPQYVDKSKIRERYKTIIWGRGKG